MFSGAGAEVVDAAGALWRMNAAKDADDTGGRDARGMNEHMVGEGEEVSENSENSEKASDGG